MVAPTPRRRTGPAAPSPPRPEPAGGPDRRRAPRQAGAAGPAGRHQQLGRRRRRGRAGAAAAGEPRPRDPPHRCVGHQPGERAARRQAPRGAGRDPARWVRLAARPGPVGRTSHPGVRARPVTVPCRDRSRAALRMERLRRRRGRRAAVHRPLVGPRPRRDVDPGRRPQRSGPRRVPGLAARALPPRRPPRRLDRADPSDRRGRHRFGRAADGRRRWVARGQGGLRRRAHRDRGRAARAAVDGDGADGGSRP